jgi:sensor histidine kinase YesM
VFQFGGWGLFAFLNFFFAITLDKYDQAVFLRILFDTEIGIIISHLMREVILRSKLLISPLKQQIITFIILTSIFAFLTSCIVSPFETIYDLQFDRYGNRPTYFSLLLANFIIFFPLFFFWNGLYFVYHFISKMRKQELDTVKLEALVKQLELQTIKAHINPHFIFNALNSIRALIDENPPRARRAITELSNILRSSLTAEKSETVPLEKELKIVKDYLALESMRFEDRLDVQFEVDEETLKQYVPPMMLQTLVENAIKHGISKQVKGGVVKIISDFKPHFHELIVQNTGHLNGSRRPGGFGLSSTKDRLTLLYGDKAKFEIRQVEPELVEAKVLIPVADSVLKQKVD